MTSPSTGKNSGARVENGFSSPAEARSNPLPTAILIPSWHRPDLLRQCLSSLARQTLPSENYEIVVVENEAQPEMMAEVPLPPNARVIPLSENLGTTGSINRALRESSSEYVLLLNNDVELEPLFLETLLSVLQNNPGYGFATGKLLSARQRDQLDGAGDALLRGGGAYRLGHGDLDRGQFDRHAPLLAGCGAATLFRRSVLEAVQGLDEDYFAYLDDLDLALRAQLAGYPGVFLPQAVAWHLGSATLGDAFHPRIAHLLTRNQLLVVVKNYPAGALIRCLPQIAVFQLLWFSLLLRRGMVWPCLRGLGGALRLLPRMLTKRRRIMRSRRLSSAEFLRLLRASEEQIRCWQAGLPRAAQSNLLRAYFCFFRPGPSKSGTRPAKV